MTSRRQAMQPFLAKGFSTTEAYEAARWRAYGLDPGARYAAPAMTPLERTRRRAARPSTGRGTALRVKIALAAHPKSPSTRGREEKLCWCGLPADDPIHREDL